MEVAGRAVAAHGAAGDVAPSDGLLRVWSRVLSRGTYPRETTPEPSQPDPDSAKRQKRVAARLADPHAGGPPAAERAASISKLVDCLVGEHMGHRPRSRTYLNDDVIMVLLEDTLTAGERRLVRNGLSELVLSARRPFHQTMRDDLIAGIEQLTGSEVRVIASQMRPDITIEVLLLDGGPKLATTEARAS
jgi:uncharacterized protein YbcI